MTDVLKTKDILRLIQSIPSPKAEPFKFTQQKQETTDQMKLLIQRKLLNVELNTIDKKLF